MDFQNQSKRPKLSLCLIMLPLLFGPVLEADAQKLDAETRKKFEAITKKAESMTKSKVPPNVEFLQDGQKKMDAGDTAGAMKLFDKSLAWKDSQEAYALRATIKHGNGDEAGAAKDYEHALKVAPALQGFPKPALLIRYAEALANSGQYDKALTNVNEAIKLDPKGDSIAYEIRGGIYVSQKKWEPAIDSFNTRISKDPNGAAYSQRADAYTQMGKFAEAIKDLNTAIKLEPKEPIYLAERSIAYLKWDKKPESLNDAKAAVKLNEDFTNLCVLGQSLIANNNMKEAIAALNKAIAKGSGDAVAEPTYMRALAYTKTGDKAKAAADFAKAKQMKFEPDSVVKKLAKSLGV